MQAMVAAGVIPHIQPWCKIADLQPIPDDGNKTSAVITNCPYKTCYPWHMLSTSLCRSSLSTEAFWLSLFFFC